MKPNFDNCLLNVTSAIQMKYGFNSKYEVNQIVFDKIKDKKHVFLIVLDGLGKNVLEKYLDVNSFLFKYSIDFISSVFPPTTVAATSALLSGKAPGETGWIGWHQYFDEFKKDIVMFKNTTYDTGEKLSIDIPHTYLGFDPFYYKFKNVKCEELYPSFKEEGFAKFNKLVGRLLEISQTDDETFTYCYWDEPDKTIHEFGLKHKNTKKVVKNLDMNLNKFYKKCGPSSAIIVVADHGLVDTKYFTLMDYPDIVECLVRRPTIETRTLAFKVKNGERFVELFRKYFGDYFILYDKKSFLESGFLGDDYKKAAPFVADYIAIATGEYSMVYERSTTMFKAAHAGGTNEEMMVPLIIATK